MIAPLALALALLPAANPAVAPRVERRPLSVAAAGNLKIAVEALEAAFEAEQPAVDVVVTLGASGAFFAQIRAGAPYDLFLSADRDYPLKLIDARLAAPGGDVVYAIGQLVAWAPRGSPVALERLGLAALRAPGIRHVAIANPAVSPFGRAAEAALRAEGLLDALRDRLVLGQSVAQAAQFAAAGAADAALIPRSLTFAPELAGGRVTEVPGGSHPRMEQSAVVLAGSPHHGIAREFLAFLTGPRGRAILARCGYALP